MIDTKYEALLQRVLETGVRKGDRTGTGTYSLFGERLRYDLSDGFPLITTKRVHLKSVVAELLWFLTGDTNVYALQEQGVKIWDAWADQRGNLGPVYGKQWRSWDVGRGQVVDQIAGVLQQLRYNPDSRRMVVSAWNVADLDKMALAPCHMLFQFYVAGGRVSCQINQRSADMFLGVPFNIASYALLTHMMAQQAGLGVGELIWIGGDCHIYANHVEQVAEQLTRRPLAFPTLDLAKRRSIDDYTLDDVSVLGYDPHPAIKAPVAV